MNFLVRRADAVAAEIGWIEVGLLSVRSEEVSVGISRGTIVYCRGCLARFRLDEWGIVWGKYWIKIRKDLGCPPKSLILLGSGARIRTWDLRVMRWITKI